jgi:hypothetical protein
MLHVPEHRKLVELQTKIDDKFALKRGGTYYILVTERALTLFYPSSLSTYIEADILYAIKLGHLVRAR